MYDDLVWTSFASVKRFWTQEELYGGRGALGCLDGEEIERLKTKEKIIVGFELKKK